MRAQAIQRRPSELTTIQAARGNQNNKDHHLAPVGNLERLDRYLDAKAFNDIFGSTPPIQIIKA